MLHNSDLQQGLDIDSHRIFFEMHKNGNNANIGSIGFTMWKQWKII